ncbi:MULTISPECIES: hypothetical protein [unclassified Flavobacterium]|uniref:hypothetical protein n=1 Tax=unclassified Flavobacterium TaxID=196869 RepID=UPI001F13C5F3|nr:MULTISPECIES: hypothetical protein [unclassified Flavobacterium]UMY64788.1 hypothetical protein MKO97_09705 [Flavobacterium sp. HJ-32-4]
MIPPTLYRFRYFIGAAVAIVLLVLGAEWWAHHKIEQWLAEQKAKGYAISYRELDISLWSRSVSLDSLIIQPSAGTRPAVSITGSVASLDISGVHLWKLLSGGGLILREVSVRKPDLHIVTDSTKKAAKASKPLFFGVAEVRIDGGRIVVSRKGEPQPYIRMDGMRVRISELASPTAADAPLPFRFDDYKVEARHFFWKTGPVYYLAAAHVLLTPETARVEGFALQPDITRSQFGGELKIEKDFYRIAARTIALSDMEWGVRNKRFFVTARRLDLHGVDALIYRDKRIPDDTRKRPLYNKLLRELPFDLDLETLAIGNARIVYEEQVNARGAGQLTFSQFDLNARSLHSGYGRQHLPDVQIAIETRFMKEATLKVDWRFNVLDQQDGFRIRGQIRNFEAYKLDPFTKPYSNVKTRGKLALVTFDITGNDRDSKGTVGMRYDDLKIRVYRKKKPSRENKIASAIGNALVANDTDDKIKSTSVDVTRTPDASFYNFLWRNVEEGMRKIIL